MKDIANGYANLMTRSAQGRQRLIDLVQDVGKLTTVEANAVADLYLSKKVRAVTIDPVSGALKIAHGDFMTFEVISRALAQTRRP